MTANRRLLRFLLPRVGRAHGAALFAACLLCSPASFAQETPEADGASQPQPGVEVPTSSSDPTSAAAKATGKEADGEKAAEDTPPEKTTAPSIPTDATPAERAAFEDYQRAYARYSGEAADYKKTVDDIVDAKYRQRVASINAAYNEKIDELSALERSNRVEAIAAFERFVTRYPRNERHTPDALFRLAELYFEKANDDYLLQDDEYQAKYALWESGQIADQPPSPNRDYGPTIRTFRTLIADWPDYRLLDGAYYLLAYCEQQRGNDETARDIFLTLIEKRPDSSFVPEAWLRIGEYYFDLDELEPARKAYAQAVSYADNRFYDKALYKLAWTHYRMDAFDKAINEFKRLIEYSDKLAAETGKSGSVLRSEAVQYAAISLAEEDWDLDGIKDDDFGLERAKRYLTGAKDYEREILAQLADYLFQNERFTECSEVAELALRRYPNHPENPQLHEQLVLALFRDDNQTRAFAERRNLGVYYGPGSDWYAVQEQNGEVEAMRYASGLVRDNLIQSATWFHEQAQKMRNEAIAQQDEGKLLKSIELYATASRTYAEFLRKHPNDKDAFQWNFYYAETLFYSEQYKDAHQQYRVVRELDLNNEDFIKFQEESAFNAVKSLEFLVLAEVNKGNLPASVLPASSGGGSTEESEEVDPEEAAESGVIKIDPLPIPPLLYSYITEMDRYVVLGLENEFDTLLDGKFAFESARLYYEYKNYDAARERFEWILKNYPGTELTGFSAALILETYRQERNYAAMAEAADRFEPFLDDETGAGIKQEIADIKLAALYKAGEKAYAEKRYEDAIKSYREMISKDEEDKYSQGAYINIAVAYESMEKYAQAMEWYQKLLKDYPKHPYASYSIYRVGVNAERFFEFDVAITNFLDFYERFATKETPKEVLALEFDFQKKGADALLNAAILLRDTQDYTKAARRFEEFVSKYGSNPKAAAAMWSAVEAWEKAGKQRDQLKAVDRYIDDYGDDPANSERVFKGLAMKATYEREVRKSEKGAKKAYQRILDEYVKRNVQPGSREAYYVAEAKFRLTEYDFEDWDRIQLKGSLKKQKKALDDKITGQEKLVQQYEAVFVYGNLEWTLAAGYRVGNLFQRFANTLYDASVPFREGSEEYDIYRTQLDDIAVPLEDEAIVRYEKIIEKAREEKVVNEWTKLALEQLNQYKPAEFPLFKEERDNLEERPITPGGLITSSSIEAPAPPPPPAPPAEEAP